MGIRNLGFGRGMCFQRGKKYLFSCYVRSIGAECTIRVTLRDGEDACLAEGRLTAKGQWEKHTAILEIADESGCSLAEGREMSGEAGGTEEAGETGRAANMILDGNVPEKTVRTLWMNITIWHRSGSLPIYTAMTASGRRRPMCS